MASIPQAGLNLGFWDQYGTPLGLLLGGLLRMRNGGGQGQPGQAAPPPIPGPFNQAQPAQVPQQAAAAPPPIPGPFNQGDMGDWSQRPVAPPPMTANANATTSNPAANATGNADLNAMIQKMTAMMNAGGLAGLGGAGNQQNQNADPLSKIGDLLKPPQPATPAAAPTLPNYAGTGPNAQLLQAYMQANSQPNQFGGPMGPAGLNPMMAFRQRQQQQMINSMFGLPNGLGGIG